MSHATALQLQRNLLTKEGHKPRSATQRPRTEVPGREDLQIRESSTAYGSFDAESDINGSPASRRQARADSIGSSDSSTDSDRNFIVSTEQAKLDASSNSDFDDRDLAHLEEKITSEPKGQTSPYTLISATKVI
jgi:hypothetical protein